MIIGGIQTFLEKFPLCRCDFSDFLLHPSRYSATACEQVDDGQYIDHATFDGVAFHQQMSSCGPHHSRDDDDCRLGVD